MTNVDIRPQLLGRGTHGPERVPPTRGPMHLWNHVSMPPQQNSVIIKTDGSVVEGCNFAAWQISGPEVHKFLYGGTIVHKADLDQFSIDALLNAGYTFGVPYSVDVYSSAYPGDPLDPDSDVYPLSPYEEA